MGIRVITPTNYLRRDIATRNLAGVNPTENKNLKPKSSRMRHEHLHRLSGSDSERFLVEASDKNFLFVRDSELDSTNRSNAFVFKFPEPLMRHLKIFQDGCGINTTDFRAPCRQTNS